MNKSFTAHLNEAAFAYGQAIKRRLDPDHIMVNLVSVTADLRINLSGQYAYQPQELLRETSDTPFIDIAILVPWETTDWPVVTARCQDDYSAVSSSKGRAISTEDMDMTALVAHLNIEIHRQSREALAIYSKNRKVHGKAGCACKDKCRGKR